MTVPPHPATFSPEILKQIKYMLSITVDPGALVLDPFAGVGNIHQLRPLYRTWGIEIEKEWADASKYTLHRDSTQLASYYASSMVEAVATSCTYGNRMADCHVPGPADKSKRITYTHQLGHALQPNNSGKMQFGREYKTLHIKVWEQVHQILPHDAPFILNVKDHIRAGKVIPVSEWHRMVIEEIGFGLAHWVRIPVGSMRFGANGDLRVPYENLYLFLKGITPNESIPAWNGEVSSLGQISYHPNNPIPGSS